MTPGRGLELTTADDCPVCGHENVLVAPDCTEGHGADCPDRLCVDCGTALFVGILVGLPRRSRRPSTRVA